MFRPTLTHLAVGNTPPYRHGNYDTVPYYLKYVVCAEDVLGGRQALAFWWLAS